MATPFLSAEWRNLLMANYEVDPAILKKHLPYKIELDDYNGNHYVSLVGFMFQRTKVLGIGIPFHRDFEELNLRFYVRQKSEGIWKRGVVFIKEMVPKPMIALVANTLYKEKYSTHPMRHQWVDLPEGLKVSYQWKINGSWNQLTAMAEKESYEPQEGSAEAFITEHYRGYSFIDKTTTGMYEVKHPRWRIHRVKTYEIDCNARALYGDDFAETLAASPASIFLADGSPIEVMKGNRIKYEK